MVIPGNGFGCACCARGARVPAVQRRLRDPVDRSPRARSVTHTGHERAAVRANHEEQLAKARDELAERERRLARALAARRRSDAPRPPRAPRPRPAPPAGCATAWATRWSRRSGPEEPRSLLPLRLAMLFVQGLEPWRARRRARAEEASSRTTARVLRLTDSRSHVHEHGPTVGPRLRLRRRLRTRTDVRRVEIDPPTRGRGRGPRVRSRPRPRARRRTPSLAVCCSSASMARDWGI